MKIFIITQYGKQYILPLNSFEGICPTMYSETQSTIYFNNGIEFVTTLNEKQLNDIISFCNDKRFWIKINLI